MKFTASRLMDSYDSVVYLPPESLLLLQRSIVSRFT